MIYYGYYLKVIMIIQFYTFFNLHI